MCCPPLDDANARWTPTTAFRKHFFNILIQIKLTETATVALKLQNLLSCLPRELNASQGPIVCLCIYLIGIMHVKEHLCKIQNYSKTDYSNVANLRPQCQEHTQRQHKCTQIYMQSHKEIKIPQRHYLKFRSKIVTRLICHKPLSTVILKSMISGILY